MNKYAIIALLAVVLIACAPVMPVKNQTTTPAENKTIETPANETSTNETVETAQPEQNATTEEPKTDLRDVPRKEVIEGELVNFPSLQAVDPDGDKITYTFTEPLNAKGEWQTKSGDEGEHMVTITASDGTNQVSQKVLIVVLPKNKPPTIELQDSITASEGETILLQPVITDPEGDALSINYSGWMDSNTKTVSYGDQGSHIVVITVSDGKSITAKKVIINVENANRAPELAEIPPKTIKEGEKVTIVPSAKDPDGDTVTFTYDFPLNESGSWKTEIGDAGKYEILVTASDGNTKSEKTFVLTVEAVNRPPVIVLASPVFFKEGEVATINPTITDPDGDEVRVTYSGWMNSNTRETTYDDAGNYKVTISARDSAGNEAALEIIVSVEDLNRPPIFGAGSFN